VSSKIATERKALPLRILEVSGSKLSTGTKYADFFFPPSHDLSISADKDEIMPQIKDLLLSTFPSIKFSLIIKFNATKSEYLGETLNVT
jgi:hypothetical protein